MINFEIDNLGGKKIRSGTSTQMESFRSNLNLRLLVGGVTGISLLFLSIPPKEESTLKDIDPTGQIVQRIVKYTVAVTATIPSLVWLKNEYKKKMESDESQSQKNVNIYNGNKFNKREKIGLMLFGVGYTISFVSRFLYLKRFYTFSHTIKKGHYIVEEGPYSVIRHPSYLGITMFFIGNALFLNNLGAHILLYMPMYLISAISKEEALLKQHFGEKWDQYCQKVTKKLVPFVW